MPSDGGTVAGPPARRPSRPPAAEQVHAQQGSDGRRSGGGGRRALAPAPLVAERVGMRRDVVLLALGAFLGGAAVGGALVVDRDLQAPGEGGARRGKGGRPRVAPRLLPPARGRRSRRPGKGRPHGPRPPPAARARTAPPRRAPRPVLPHPLRRSRAGGRASFRLCRGGVERQRGGQRQRVGGRLLPPRPRTRRAALRQRLRPARARWRRTASRTGRSRNRHPLLPCVGRLRAPAGGRAASRLRACALLRCHGP